MGKDNKPRTFESVQKQVKELVPSLEVISIGKNSKEKITVHCNQCGQNYQVMLGNIVKRPHCLACSNSIPIKGYNTLGDLHPELLKYFVDSEDAFKVLPHTRKDLRLKCPDCGSIKTMRGIDLIKRGFSCAVCSDKISYPNKFLRNFMFELKRVYTEIIFDFEYLPSWRKDKRYDGYFYFNQKKYLIEMQGEQHYTGRWGSLEYQQENDNIKKVEAIEHGWRFIEINCRQSDFDFIKNEILNSAFNQIFDMNLINWNKIREESEKNIVKKVCDAYNSITKFSGKLAELFKLSQCTIIDYLSRGHKIGWVNYLGEDGKPKFTGKKYKIIAIYDENWNCVAKVLGLNQAKIWIEQVIGKSINIRKIRDRCYVFNKRANIPYYGYYFRYVGNNYANYDEKIDIVKAND